MAEDHEHNHMIISLKKLSVQECDQDHQEEEQNCSKINNIVVPFPDSMPVTPPSSPHLELEKLEIPSYEVPEMNDNGDDLKDGLKTPKSLDHKIQLMLEVSGAPRKKITWFSSPMKRAAGCHRLVFDLSEEVESISTTTFMEDLDSLSFMDDLFR